MNIKETIVFSIVLIVGLIGMCISGYMFCTLIDETDNASISECQTNITTVPVTVDTPESFWGQECMDCHQNPHDPMQGVPSETVFDGHKNLDCVFCHADYDKPQKCISCHEGHNIFHRR